MENMSNEMGDVSDVPSEGGLISNYEVQMMEAIHRAEDDRVKGRLAIPTGIPLIDRHMGGLRRKELSGIIGYISRLQETVIHTMAYSAASAGFRVLHVTVKADPVDELMAYGVIHAHALGEKSRRFTTVTKQKLDDGLLSKSERDELSEARDYFALTIGKSLIVRKPTHFTWPAVKWIIKRECQKAPLDLVIVDSLSRLNDPSAWNAEYAMAAIVQDAKQVALNANNGRGLAFVTLVQGSRRGWEEASERDGAWEATGISPYPDMGMFIDNCFYVYTNDDISTSGQMKMGTCKYRRGANIPASFVRLNVKAGVVAPAVDEEIRVGNTGHGDRVRKEPGKLFGFLDPA